MKYLVHCADGKTVKVTADFVFNNYGGLVFRTGEKGSIKVVAEFAAGHWTRYVKLGKRA